MLEMWILKGCFFVLLILLSAQDLRWRRLSPGLLGAAFLLSLGGFGLRYMTGEGTGLLTGLLPGACFLGLSMAAGKQLGKGDGLVLAAIGGLLGLSGCLVALSFGLLLAAFCAGYLMVVRKASRKQKLPFVPFLTVGYLAGVMLI